tara:strand:+ start:732 stop:1052 length:321 start_codon:yes stop_codon:yes gene_type:complete
MIPIICKDNTIITNPAAILNSIEFCKRTWPKKVEAAPNIMKTKEKPTVKKIIGNIFIFLFSTRSFNEFPETYEIYPGISGSTQGDRKLINPAPSAIKISNIKFYSL